MITFFVYFIMKYLIAHRGLDNHKFKENSIEAFLYCLEQEYINGIEIDVRITKDKKIIMYHNYLYNLRKVSEMYYKKMKNIDLLENLLKKIKTDKMILIDIKNEASNYKNMVKYLVKLLNKYPLNYYLSSFNYNLIIELQKKIKYPVGIFITDLINKTKNITNLNFIALSKNSFNDIGFPLKLVWTINNKNNISKYTYIITDKAYLLK